MSTGKGSKRPNWAALRLEYVNSTMTLQELADKRGVSFASLMKQASRPDKDGLSWAEARKNLSEKVSIEAQKILVAETVDELTLLNRRDLAIAKRMRDIIEALLAGAIEEDPESGAITVKMPASELRQLAGALLNAQKATRTAMGLPTEIHEHAGPGGGAIPLRPSFDEKDIPLVKEAVMWALKNV